MPVPTVSVQDLKKLRDEKKPHYLLDVREQDEYQLCRIEGSTLIPLREVPGRAGELPKDKTIVVHCHHGGRSAQAAAYLIQQGYQAVNLAGGIDAWSEEIDSTVPRY